MIKSNLIKIGDNYSALDFNIEDEKSKITTEYLIILYSLLSNKILDKEDIEMFTEIVTLAIKGTNNNFEKFVKGVLSAYKNS